MNRLVGNTLMWTIKKKLVFWWKLKAEKFEFYFTILRINSGWVFCFFLRRDGICVNVFSWKYIMKFKFSKFEDFFLIWKIKFCSTEIHKHARSLRIQMIIHTLYWQAILESLNFVFFSRLLLCSPGWSPILDLPASASRVQESLIYGITPC